MGYILGSFNYYDDMCDIAEYWGYEPSYDGIKQAMIDAYRDVKSGRGAGEYFDMTGAGILANLRQWGIKIRPRGGYQMQTKTPNV